ncbi:unnamed protein product [Pedinophyceae sp. YPF-701]|nr:unnamed protein product [Pedinophyceae sp. YPF-701]
MSRPGTANEDKSVRFVADFQLDGTDEILQLPIVRSGKYKKLWKGAVNKVGLISGHVSQSDDNLTDYLKKVGKYFGRDPDVWMPEGEPRNEVIEEAGKRVVKRTARFAGWSLSLVQRLPFYDARLNPIDGRADLDFSVEQITVSDNAAWRNIIMDQPWSPSETRHRVALLMEAKILSSSEELQLEGLHGMWELLVNKDHHADITEGQLKLVLEAVTHQNPQCAAVATAAVWTMTPVLDSRHQLLAMDAVGILTKALKRCLEQESSGGAPTSGMQYKSLKGISRMQSLAVGVLDDEDSGSMASGEHSGSEGDAREEEREDARSVAGRSERMPGDTDDENEEDGDHVWWDYQEALLGALGVLFVDRLARMSYLKVEPSLDTLLRFCENESGPNPAWIAERRSLAARCVCMMVHRDPDVRATMARGQGVLERVLALIEVDAAGPGAAHVKLCFVTVLAIMVLDDVVMEYIRVHGLAHRLFSACLTTLDQMVKIMTPGDEIYRLMPDPRAVLAMAEGLSQAMWGASYECCLPKGGGLTEAELMQLADVGFRLMDNREFRVDRVLRCIATALANAASSEPLAEIMMRPEPRESEPLPSDISDSEEEEYYDTPWQREEREKKLAEKRRRLEALRAQQLEEEARRKAEELPHPRGPAMFLMALFDRLPEFDPEQEPHCRISLCAAFALLAGHPFDASGEEAMHGPHRAPLLRMGMFPRLLEAIASATNDPFSKQFCEITGSFACMQLCTEAGGLPAALLARYVTIMRNCKDNVELVEYMMAGLWILLRRDDNRQHIMGHMAGVGQIAGAIDGDALQEVGEALLDQVAPEDEVTPPAVGEEDGEEDGGGGDVEDHFEGMAEFVASQGPGDGEAIPTKESSPEFNAQASVEDVDKQIEVGVVVNENEAVAEMAREMERKAAELAAAKEEGKVPEMGVEGLGLEVILDVGFSWLDRLLGMRNEEDEDAPLVKLFEFLVSGLCLLVTDAEPQPRQYEQLLFEQDAAQGSDKKVWWGVSVTPPEEDADIGSKYNDALALMCKLLHLTQPVAAKILQLTINALWTITLSHQGAERFILEAGATEQLLRIAMSHSLPPRVRDAAIGLIADLFEYYPNVEHMGGAGPLVKATVDLLSTRTPLLEHRAALVLGRIASVAPHSCPDAAQHLHTTKRTIAKKGAVKALVTLVRHTHQRYIAFMEQAPHSRGKAYAGSRGGVRDAKGGLTAMGRATAAYKRMGNMVLAARGKGHEHGAEDLDAREMTMLKAMYIKRAAKGGATDAWNDFEEDMNNYPMVVSLQSLALKALLNVSTIADNQTKVCRKGLFTILGINSYFSQMVSFLGTDSEIGPEHELLELSSKILQNMALHPENRTRMFRAELRGATRLLEGIAEDRLIRNGTIEAPRVDLQKEQKRLLPPLKRQTELAGEPSTFSPSRRSVKLAKGRPTGRAPSDSIRPSELQRPKVMFPPLITGGGKNQGGTHDLMFSDRVALSTPQEAAGAGTERIRLSAQGPRGAAEGGGGEAQATVNAAGSSVEPERSRGTVARGKFHEWQSQVFPPAQAGGVGGVVDPIDSESSDDGMSPMEYERSHRIQMPSLAQSLRKPMAHLWQEARDWAVRHGHNRWNPKVSEYHMSKKPMTLQAAARGLLSTRDPPMATRHLTSASLDLANTGKLYNLNDAVTTKRPATPDRDFGKKPLTMMVLESDRPTMRQLSAMRLPVDSPGKGPGGGVSATQFLGSTGGGQQKEQLGQSLLVALNPTSARSVVSFEDKLRDHAPGRDGYRVRLSMFGHVPGARVYDEAGIPKYELPNGKEAFMYLNGGLINDVIEVAPGVRPARPSTFPSALQRHLPLAGILDAIAKPPGSGLDIMLLKPIPKLARLPSIHTLPVRNPEVLEGWAFGDLEEINLRFLLVTKRVNKEETSTMVQDVEAPRPRTPWRLPDSIFKPRVKESDARGFFDTHQVEDKSFERCWRRLTSKDKFMGMLSRENKADKDKDEKVMVRDLQAVLRKHWALIQAVFMYFSTSGSGSVFTLELNDFTSFLDTCEIPDNDSEYVKKSDCDTVFIVSNYIADRNDPEAKLRSEHNMMRVQFMEALVRLSLSKFGKGQATNSISDAVDMLFEELVIPKVPEYAKVETNWFRRERLYFEEVDVVLKANKAALLALYSRYRLPPKSGGLRPKVWKLYCWEAFIQDAKLLDEDFSLQQSSLCYVWSRMTTVDEIGKFAKFESLTFIDFLEGLGRIADIKSLPSLESVKEMGLNNMLDWKLAVDSGSIARERRPSMGIEAAKTRPLSVKVESLLDLTFRQLMYIPGEQNDFTIDKFTRKMKRDDHALGS